MGIHVRTRLDKKQCGVERRRRPRLSMYARERIRQMLSNDLSHTDIVSALRLEGITTCRQTVWRLEKHIGEHGTIQPLLKSGRPMKLTAVVLEKIDAAMTCDDETTAKELVTTLQDAGTSVVLINRSEGSSPTWLDIAGNGILSTSSRSKSGEETLVGSGTPWCELYEVIVETVYYHDVIWTDETLVQMKTHRRFCCRKTGQKPHYKPKPKHPVKVHVWAGISCNGATNACIFEEISE